MSGMVNLECTLIVHYPAYPINSLEDAVLSSIVCKFSEGFLLPVFIQVAENSKYNTIYTS